MIAYLIYFFDLIFLKNLDFPDLKSLDFFVNKSASDYPSLINRNSAFDIFELGLSKFP